MAYDGGNQGAFCPLNYARMALVFFLLYGAYWSGSLHSEPEIQLEGRNRFWACVLFSPCVAWHGMCLRKKWIASEILSNVTVLLLLHATPIPIDFRFFAIFFCSLLYFGFRLWFYVIHRFSLYLKEKWRVSFFSSLCEVRLLVLYKKKKINLKASFLRGFVLSFKQN